MADFEEANVSHGFDEPGRLLLASEAPTTPSPRTSYLRFSAMSPSGKCLRTATRARNDMLTYGVAGVTQERMIAYAQRFPILS